MNDIIKYQLSFISLTILSDFNRKESSKSLIILYRRMHERGYAFNWKSHG